MKISKEGLNLIKSFEGFSSKPYICPGGYKTIGYGHMLKKGEKIESVSEEEALHLLEEGVKQAEISVLKLTKIPLKQNQFDALVSFVFNLGSGAYQRSTLRAKLNRGEHDAVPEELLRWVSSNGRVLIGLVKRRKAEVTVYLK
jgi:lysozyme